MTKLGTPSGAGPKGAIVVVGLASVGVPPLEYCEPPFEPFGGSCTPAVAGGALTPPELPPPPPLLSPRLWLWWTPLPPPLIEAPVSKPPPWLSGAAGAAGASTLLFEVGGGAASGSSLVSAGEAQSGSSASTRPSPSSSSSLAQAGVLAAAGAIGGVVVSVSSDDVWSAPAKPTPSAVTMPKLARAMISASLFLMRRRPYTRWHGSCGSPAPSPCVTGRSKLLAHPGARNGSRRPPTRP